MRFKYWFESCLRDRNKVISGLTEDPMLNLMIKMFRSLGIKARGFDVEDYIKDRSGMLANYKPSIMVGDKDTLSINTNIGHVEEPLDSNVHKFSPYWRILVRKED
jgi:hypothetical protein